MTTRGARLLSVLVLALLAHTGCGGGGTGVEARRTSRITASVRVEVTSSGPSVPFTGFVSFGGQSVDIDGRTPFVREFPNVRIEQTCSEDECTILVSAFARKNSSNETLRLCLSIIGGRMRCDASTADAIILFL